MFQNIMVASGGSPWSDHAVQTAVRLAADTQQSLLIVHVLDDDPQFQSHDVDPTDPEMRDEIEATGKVILEHAVGRASELTLPPRTTMPWGEIAEQLVQTAQAESCDLIVMGTRHLTGDKRLMTGRICNAVIATAPCPVLVVPFLQ